MYSFNDCASGKNIGRPPQDDEYIGDDGLIYCKKCRTARQQWFGKGTKVAILAELRCDCLERESQKEAYEQAIDEKKKQIEKARAEAIEVATYRTFRFESDDGKTPKITKVAQKYVDMFDLMKQKGQGLMFWGAVGTGKTYLAMCIANALIDKQYRIKCTTLSQVVKQAQDFKNADEYLDEMKKCDCIVVDDVGTERGTAFANEQIFNFIDMCNIRNIPLIITTNLLPSELETASKDTADLTFARIYSRILEKCYPIKVNEVNRREENAKSNKEKLNELLQISEIIKQKGGAKWKT